jgi:undecaprenyl-diphosphatase
MSLQGSLSFDIWLNTATLFAVIICFWSSITDIWHDFVTEGLSSHSRTLLFAIIVGSIPAGIVGFVYGDSIEQIFRSAHSVAWALILGSIIMFLADYFQKLGGGLSILKGFVVGCFQTLALISGFSRSGMTISGGLHY